ncbi:hypothetical protein TBLA_0A08200 [Henningerozyma blattae CBS 6284]|uniref:C2H2-type domain-containing protein n=1 Tax=Henningerozyma blattae (strain ATCC 34711 / CBS 6284 / DSM 70876 / NBRC 10599 / NRRL Y-10934 / UCD 77-7) TaxID=1071380 RepID=I2GWV8_HENB6|nr:hypothetical protein TBLA_0A08200 [Tetrapisispora blattae CBS 6284]CCH58610.1 hypothetical protein TBLA_0A08200 [Tetrapisispora blattae CBS 6284]
MSISHSHSLRALLNDTPSEAAATVVPPTIQLPPISSFDNLVKAAEFSSTRTTGLASCASISSLSSVSASAMTSANTSANTSDTEDHVYSPYHTANTPQLQNQLQNQLTRSSNLAVAPSSKKLRKKKQCHICKKFYANLSTHKSTHITPENRPHKCEICHRGFARNNDLIRHKKRHWKDNLDTADSAVALDNSSSTSPVAVSFFGTPRFPAVKNEDPENEDTNPSASSGSGSGSGTNTSSISLRTLHNLQGAYKCPYNSSLIQLDMEIYPHKINHLKLNFETSNCHQTGVFSRCDTFKNHLKALHFEYPPGTKKKDRLLVSGRCKHCGLKFKNVDVWLKTHVGKECGHTYH